MSLTLILLPVLLISFITKGDSDVVVAGSVSNNSTPFSSITRIAGFVIVPSIVAVVSATADGVVAVVTLGSIRGGPPPPPPLPRLALPEEEPVLPNIVHNTPGKGSSGVTPSIRGKTLLGAILKLSDGVLLVKVTGFFVDFSKTLVYCS